MSAWNALGVQWRSSETNQLSGQYPTDSFYKTESQHSVDKSNENETHNLNGDNWIQVSDKRP